MMDPLDNDVRVMMIFKFLVLTPSLPSQNLQYNNNNNPSTCPLLLPLPSLL